MPFQNKICFFEINTFIEFELLSPYGLIIIYELPAFVVMQAKMATVEVIHRFIYLEYWQHAS